MNKYFTVQTTAEKFTAAQKLEAELAKERLSMSRRSK